MDLKFKAVEHHDIGQMNVYLGYFAAEENAEGDNPPIGLVLSRDKNELLVEYATFQMNSQLYVQGGIDGEEKTRAGLNACSVATTAHIKIDDTCHKEMPLRYLLIKNNGTMPPLKGTSWK
jgi:hypothetical protein